MFGKFFKALRNQGTGSTSIGSQIDARDQIIRVSNEQWAYQQSFTTLPEDFFRDMDKFLRKVKQGWSEAIWTHHQLTENLFAYILVFDPGKPRLTNSKSLMAAAIYRSPNNTPVEFYVLVEIESGIRIRQVNSDLASWVINNGFEPVICNPNLDCFVDFLRLKAQQAPD